jgi:hypothetical protein
MGMTKKVCFFKIETCMGASVLNEAVELEMSSVLALGTGIR